MTSVQNDTTRVYSNDRQLYVGMTGRDAYEIKDKYELFQVADKNQNDTISDAEIRRYNGPILVVEKDNHLKQRFLGKYNGHTWCVPSEGNVSGRIISSNEFDFYPGQKIEEIDPNFKKAFRDLDLDGDGELTSNEIGEYQKFVQRRQEMYDKIAINKEIANKNAENKSASLLGGGFIGAWIGIAAAIATENSKHKIGCLGVLASIGITALTLWTCASLNQKKYQTENEIKQEYAEVIQKEEQYKNVLSNEI